MKIRRLAALAALALTFAARAASGGVEAEVDAASVAAKAAQVQGPEDIALGSQARLSLPSGYTYVPPEAGARLLQAMGNHTGPGFMGLVFGEAMQGFVTIAFEDAGYVRDDDARDWDADELLQNLKDGTEAGNRQRRERGIPEFVVGKWIEVPSYDSVTHRLVWSAEVLDKYPAADAVVGVNYNTYQLGREGYISMNLVTDLDEVEGGKPHARRLLRALEFNEGKRYADFDGSTDRVAAYGLAALVGGVAAKKLGLLAAAGVFLVKFWKLAVLAVLGFGAVVKKALGGKSA